MPNYGHLTFNRVNSLLIGDPMSPLLFGLCMEYLSKLFDTCLPASFNYHAGCKTLKLVHFSFADDFMIFSGATLESIQAIHDILMHFSMSSSMHINENKSSIFFSTPMMKTNVTFLVF